MKMKVTTRCIGSSAEAFTAQTTCIVDVLSAGIDRAALTEFDIAISPLGRTAYSTEAPVSPADRWMGSRRPARGGRDDLDLIDTRPPEPASWPPGGVAVHDEFPDLDGGLTARALRGCRRTACRRWPPIEPQN
jgi:hypothetical protein